MTSSVNTHSHFSGPLAFLIPVTQSAISATKIKTNRLRCSPATHPRQLSHLPKKHTVSRIDSSLFLGRRYISFGAGRAVEGRLPAVQGVDRCHFLFRLEQETGYLSLINKSQSGLYILNDRENLLCPLEEPLLISENITRISIGKNTDLVFDIMLGEPYTKRNSSAQSSSIDNAFSQSSLGTLKRKVSSNFEQGRATDAPCAESFWALPKRNEISHFEEPSIDKEAKRACLLLQGRDLSCQLERSLMEEPVLAGTSMELPVSG